MKLTETTGPTFMVAEIKRKKERRRKKKITGGKKK